MIVWREVDLRGIYFALSTPTARLYVEPTAVFAAHHETFHADQALAVLRALA
ncbi:MAG TPA: hypothetical protein VN837_04955 [Chloroflexota bacterium]|nr:hypothetical protein [Chloroflexota bacterium]